MGCAYLFGHCTASNLGISSDTLTLTSYSMLISAQFVPFMATNTKNPDLQKRAVIERKAALSNIETTKELKLVLGAMVDGCSSSKF